jgi:hypothetical protein
MAIDVPEIETSPLSGRLTREGVTVDVQIYRIAAANEGWTLETMRVGLRSGMTPSPPIRTPTTIFIGRSKLKVSDPLQKTRRLA